MQEQNPTACFHCGEEVIGKPIIADKKNFCCDGCKMVYKILNQSGLCDYYEINPSPGANQRVKVREGKFSFLDNEKIAQTLITFQNNQQTHTSFYLPQIHCSSCLWLLENMHRINPYIISCKVNFVKKEVDIVFDHKKLSLQQVAELLTQVGYEPYISLNNLAVAQPKINRDKLYKMGVAGFCFANIMLLSFPEYLGIDVHEKKLQSIFRYLNLLLSLPVFFYASTEFYNSAWKSLKHGFLNVDFPVAIAIIITFGRSAYEVFNGTSGGFFDSMSGLVFFMLVGRISQDKTYQQLSFERDYTSYFPIAVTQLNKDNTQTPIALPDIKKENRILIHGQELIPVDGILTKGKAIVDYSFVTGESVPIEKEIGEIIYAGGKQLGSNIELLVVKEVAQSYLTKLWNREELHQEKNNSEQSFVHALSRNFTYLILAVATITAAYWYCNDANKIWRAATAVLIVACPCALLLSHTFANGNILRLLGLRKFYLRNAQTIEVIGKANCIVFDKTGTLTTGLYQNITYEGNPLTDDQQIKIATLTAQSTHPMSKSIVAFLNKKLIDTTTFKEISGAGIEGFFEKEYFKIGSKKFVGERHTNKTESAVYVSINKKTIGKFILKNSYRDGMEVLLQQLATRYKVAILSGDNDGEKTYLQSWFLAQPYTLLLFNQQPEDKLDVIKKLQHDGNIVLMIGDGLNDAGALKQANAGIAVAENTNVFTPASDAILDAKQLPHLLSLIKICKLNKKLVLAAFCVSIVYNVVGISFAVQGLLSPLMAAILMPCSTISILVITYLFANIYVANIRTN